jgi:uncharacterized protein YjbI with pentapeptide repeats
MSCRWRVPPRHTPASSNERSKARSCSTVNAEFGNAEFGKAEFGKAEFGKAEFGKAEFGKAEFLQS